ncbi:MAG: HAMP domain-containing protein [Chloroflexi bacterium]|nr:HAMP domain-containing protein [Chloroflexota bacterium]
MQRLSLRTKLLGSFIVVLLPMLGLLAYGYSQANERRTEALLDSQMQTAQAVASLVDASFDEAFALARALANDPVVQTLDPSQIDPHLERLAPQFPRFEALSVINMAGDVVGISSAFPPGVSRKGIVADRPSFQRLVTTGQPVESELVVSRQSLRPTTAMGVPLRDGEGRVIGAVFIALYLDAFSEDLRSFSLGPEQVVFLVDREGTVALHTALPNVGVEQRNLGHFEPVRAALEGSSNKARRFVSPLLGDTRIGAFTPTPKHGWVVGVTEREDIALAPVKEGLRSQLIGFGAVSILTVGIGMLLSRVLIGPVRRLSDYAVSLGRGDLTKRVDIRSGDEMEELAGTLNKMAERLERTMTEVRRREQEQQALSQVAQALVRERTLEGAAAVVVEQAREVLGTKTVGLFLVDIERDQLRLVAHRGYGPQTVAELEVVPLSAPLLAAVAARTGQPQEVADVLAPDSGLEAQPKSPF